MQLYKPNSSNKGHGISFSLNSKDAAVYIQVIKQTSWNPQTKKGEFRGGAKFNVKLNATEIAGIISSLESNSTKKFFHSSEKGSVSISFAPYVKDGIQNGFTLSLLPSSQQNPAEKYGFWFNTDESVLVREWLSWALKRIFDAAYAAAKKAFEDKQKAQESRPPARPTQPEPAPTPEFDPNNSDPSEDVSPDTESGASSNDPFSDF